MRFSLIVVLLLGFAACDSSTGPDSDFMGQYDLSSVDGDTLLIHPMPDGSDLYTLGVLRIESSGGYSYAVLTQTCYINGCTAPDVFESKGVWTADGSTVTLKDVDGSSESWLYSNRRMSGISGHLSKPGTSLVFRRCDETKSDDCLTKYLGG
jgi:hypothetical protein